MKSLWDIPRRALCPVRPPQTAIGRPAGTLLGSAPVPVAVSTVAPKTVSQTGFVRVVGVFRGSNFDREPCEIRERKSPAPSGAAYL